MKNKSEILDELLKSKGLRCYSSDFNGQKKITVLGIEGSGFDFNLSLTFHGDIHIEDFKGTIKITEFCKILLDLEKILKENGLFH